MHSTYKPTGYNSASPYFIVKDAQRYIDLMKEIFDAQELRRFEMPDGSIVHAEIKIDDSVLMLSEATEKYPPVPMVMHVYVTDVDQTFEKVLKTDCEIIEKPKQNENDPDRRATFQDFVGNIWSIGTQIL